MPDAGRHAGQHVNERMQRVFTDADLHAVPSDWRIGGPDFVGVAGAKAGTSWWYSLLIDHPQILPNRLHQKELCYFHHFGYERIGEEQCTLYHRAFASPPGAICGEWSPAYLIYPFCLHHLARAAPEVRILVILRNPVDRTISHLNQLYSVRLPSFSLPKTLGEVFKTFSLYPEAIFQSLYAHPLRQLFRYFDRKQILLLQFEHCAADPEGQIARTYRFLGVDDAFKPPHLRRSVNRKSYVVDRLDEPQRRQMADYFRDDVLATTQLAPEIDLSWWSDFSG